MSVERYTGVIPASGVQQFAGGNFALLLATSASVNLRSERNGTAEGFNGVTGGLLIKRVQPWENLRITGTAGTTFDIIVGSEQVAEDETDIRLQIATIAGTAVVNQAPFPTFTTIDDIPITSGSQIDYPQNLARRAIVVGSLASNTPATQNLRVRDAAGTTAAGVELQPGTFVRIPTTAAVRIRNNDANTQSIWIYEEL